MNARRNSNFGNAGTDAATPGGWRAVGATPSLRSPLRARSPGPRAFTLTEILIVIGLIVLVISLAVPAFNAMTGGRSIDAATNQLSAMLGRARMEAIGLQEPRGLLFYRDPATQRIAARLVRTGQASATGVSSVSLDLVPNSDPMFLPVGVGLQLVDDYAVPPKPKDDRYIGFNKQYGTTTFETPVGGVILFDQSGRLSSRPYGLVRWNDPRVPNATPVPSEMGNFLYRPDLTKKAAPTGQPQVVAPPVGMRSQFGFVLYDEDTFKNAGGTDEDPQLGVANTSEVGEENWLDTNATPVLINRYNGTLVRGE